MVDARADLIAAGLYDPAAPDAAHRAELLDYLISVGASIEEMQEADAEDRLFGLSGDRLIRPGRNVFTWAEVAEKAGISIESCQRGLRAYGLPYAGPDVVCASDKDVELLKAFAYFAEISTEANAIGLARVMGAAMSKVADAASQSVRGANPGLLLGHAPTPTDTARTFAEIAGRVPRLGAQLDTLFRHHLVVARRHFEASDSADIASLSQVRHGVGFADLIGFTELSARLQPSALGNLLAIFENTASDIIDLFGGRIVKFIGDEVFFVTPTAKQAVAIGAAIVAAAPMELPAKVGLAYGPCLAMEGDYFGEPVNLASRLVDLAQGGELIADLSIAGAVQDDPAWVIEELAPMTVRGFVDPVSAAKIRAASVG